MSYKLEHISHVLDASNIWWGNGDVVVDEVLGVYNVGVCNGRGSHHHEGSSWFCQPLVKSVMGYVVDVESRYNKVIFSFIFSQFFLIYWVFDTSSSKRVKTLGIVDSGGKGSGFHAHFVSKLYSQVSKPSNTDNGAGASGFDVPLDGSINSDACTEDGRDLVEAIVEPWGDLEGPVVIDLHVGAVASEILSVKVDTLLAHVCLLLFVCAVSAGVVRVADWTDPNVVSYF